MKYLHGFVYRLPQRRARRLVTAWCRLGKDTRRDLDRLFGDGSFYLVRYPDVAEAHFDPLVHYLLVGGREARDPHQLFDASFYFRHNWDVEIAGVNPLVHYLSVGAREGRDPHQLFDSSYYLERNPDVAAAGLNPLVHYLDTGASEGRDPHALFDSGFYLKQNPDVAAANVNPLAHYLFAGALEGRDPHPLFDTSFYLEQAPAIVAVNPLLHYLDRGAREGRNPHPLFDSSFYLARNPDVDASGVSPLVHYVSCGEQEGRDPNPLFAVSWYRQQLRKRQPTDETGTFVPAASTERPNPHRKKIKRSQADVIYAFTSICLNYLPKARVLATTLKRYNPELCFCLLVNEPIPGWISDKDLASFDEVIEIDALDIPNRKRWIFKHTMVELSTAVKGFYMKKLLARPGCRGVFYFDPDITIWSSLEPLIQELQNASVLLTPHLTVPDSSVEAIVDNEICALRHGVYNLGFLCVKPSPEGIRFAEWWCERLEKFCIVDIPNGLFVDQRWIDLAPGFFSDIRIIRHSGCNVATWNLAHRHIDGSLEKGFTVNGQPLVFYHFSGFDSGAQQVMLHKYGSLMPAAHALRRWYTEQTKRPEDKKVAAWDWAYGFFSDGGAITDEQRRLYGTRVDLQEAFPDPFDVSATFSYRSWFNAEMLNLRSPNKATGESAMSLERSPLVHYLNTWQTVGLRPNPFFDPRFYSRNNADVEHSGLDPLSHYLHIGASQGSNPEAGFDTEFYLAHIPQIERPRNALVHYLETGRAQHLRTSPLFDPIADSKTVGIVRRWCDGDLPIVLAVMHHVGGGTERHVRDLADYLFEKVRMLAVAPALPPRHKTIRLQVLDSFLRVEMTFDPVGQRETFVEFLRSLEVARVHVHHTLGNEHYLDDLIVALGVPFDFTLHDYYSLAPNPHLVGDDGRFVGEDLAAQEGQLLRSATGSEHPTGLLNWQRAHEWLLYDADRVIAPSHDVAARVRNVKGVSAIVAAHPERSSPSPSVMVSPKKNSDVFKIGLLGHLAYHKGLEVLCRCARLNYERGGRLFFLLVGEPAGRREELEWAGVRMTGRYLNHDLPALLRAEAPDLLWYPSQAPETYSYTLSEGLASGLPLVVPDLGAFPERVGGRRWTWVQPWSLEPEEWLAFFERIHLQHFTSGEPPAIPEERVQASAEFYESEYLRPLREARAGRKPGQNRSRRDEQATSAARSR